MCLLMNLNEILPHSLYSPSVSAADFHLSGSLKSFLRQEMSRNLFEKKGISFLYYIK